MYSSKYQKLALKWNKYQWINKWTKRYIRSLYCVLILWFLIWYSFKVENVIFPVCRKWDMYTSGYRFSDSSVITHTAHTQFIHLPVLLIQICCNSWALRKKHEKNRYTDIAHFVPCGLSPTTACNREQRNRWNLVIQWSLVLRLPLIEKKAALQDNGKKIPFSSTFSYLEILCPIVTFVYHP